MAPQAAEALVGALLKTTATEALGPENEPTEARHPAGESGTLADTNDRLVPAGKPACVAACACVRACVCVCVCGQESRWRRWQWRQWWRWQWLKCQKRGGGGDVKQHSGDSRWRQQQQAAKQVGGRVSELGARR